MLIGPQDIYEAIERTINKGKRKHGSEESEVLEILQHYEQQATSLRKQSSQEPALLQIEEKKMNLLHLACMNGWEKLLTYVTTPQCPLYINPELSLQTDSTGKTPLEYARESKKPDVLVRILQQHFPIVNQEPKIRSIVPTFDDLQHDHFEFDAPLYHPLTQELITSMQPQSANLHKVLGIVEKLASLDGSHIPPKAPIKYLVAQGGGAKGAAYTGTVKAMDETGTLQNLKAVGGASAGAINAFMIGLGLNAEQIKMLITNLSFLDLNDYSDSYATKLHGALNHSGENFFNWACALMEHVAGDPNITFREYRELCKKNPNLKEMIFKGSSLDSAEEVTFSADNEATADVRIVDAVRASMSFPGAFKPWPVMKKAGKELKLLGHFTDGGVLNNFPITVFNEKSYEDPHYPRVDTKVGNSSDKIPRNPCAVGLALCSQLKKLNPEITPLTPRIMALLLNKDIASKQKIETIEEELKAGGWAMSDLAYVLAKHKFGFNAEDPEAKYMAYKDQTILIYTEGVGTLEFSLNPEKLNRIEDSGYQAWMKWFQVKQAPNQTDDSADFSLDLFPKTAGGKLIPNPTAEENTLHFQHLLAEYFSALLIEADASKGYPLDAQDPAKNQRMKFYANRISQVIALLPKKELSDSVEKVVEMSFAGAVEKYEYLKQLRKEHLLHVQQLVDEDQALDKLVDLIKSKDQLDHEKALRLFKGKLATTFKYMEKTHGQILALAAKSGDSALLSGMLEMLDITDKMLTQTSRPQRYELHDLLNEVSPLSLYKYGIESKKSSHILPILIKHHIDPLRLDDMGKNAFQYAIDAGDIEALELLVEYCQNKRISLDTLCFGPNDDTVGHYLIRTGNIETLTKLRDQPLLLKSLVSKTATNGDGATCAQLAARLYYKDDVKHEESELQQHDSLATLRLHCGAQGNIGDIVLFTKTNAAQFNEKALEKRKIVERVNKIKQELLLISDNKTMKKRVSGLTFEECMMILNSPSETAGLNFLTDCAITPKLGELGAALLHQASSLSYSKLWTTAEYTQFVKMITKKYNHQSPLYHAAVNNNAIMVAALRHYDAPVNNAGPIANPNALTAAAKAGSCSAIIELINSKPYISSVKISRRKADNEGKTVMHYLAQSKNPQAKHAMFTVLSTGITNFHNVSSQPDLVGNSPFYYLLQNPNALEILSHLAEQGKGFKTTWYLDTYFDFTTQRSNGYTDLEWAYKTNPKLAEFVATHLYDKALAENAKARIKGEISEEDLALSISFIESKEKKKSEPKVTILSEGAFQIIEEYDPHQKGRVPTFTPHHQHGKAQISERLSVSKESGEDKKTEKKPNNGPHTF